MTLLGIVLFASVYALFLVLWIALGKAAAIGDRMMERTRREALVRIQEDRGNGWRS